MSRAVVAKRPRSSKTSLHCAAFAPVAPILASSSFSPNVVALLPSSTVTLSSFTPRATPGISPAYLHHHHHHVSHIIRNHFSYASISFSPSSASDTHHADDMPATNQAGHCKTGRALGSKHTDETRRKISYSMLGKSKSAEMRAKVSEKLKGRIPWNKGKKLSAETKARMSAAKAGSQAWNKGLQLSSSHKDSISLSATYFQRVLSEETKSRMRMAKRRPGDAIVSGNSVSSQSESIGNYSLVGTNDINDYISLRRELRVWSDNYVKKRDDLNDRKGTRGRRPTLAEIRREASVPIIRKFEKYVAMRDKMRGLAGDVYGDVDPESVPAVSTKDLASSPRNNNADRRIVTTKHGNTRLINVNDSDNVGYVDRDDHLQGSREDMWDMYDRPSSLSSSRCTNSEIETENSLIGVHVLENGLSANDFRKIGRYRLMETMDINRYVELRKTLQNWSKEFKEINGRVPSLSDAKNCGILWYSKFCDYLDMREKMEGLVKEVYGTEVDDFETLKKLNAEGKQVLNALLGSSPSSSPSSLSSTATEQQQNNDGMLKAVTKTKKA